MPADLLCFSHLRWDGVTQRPQHLATQASRGRRVVVVEEPRIDDGRPCVTERVADGVLVVTPVIPDGIPDEPRREILSALTREVATRHAIERPWLWFWTPVMFPWVGEIEAEVAAVVYDCMDDLHAFRGASRELALREAALLRRADVVFTGGQALYEARRQVHRRVHPMPSSVDVEHFRRAREPLPEPEDQSGISRPRIGWFGVIDERFDGALVAAVAAARPQWEFVLVGPTAKIEEHELPAAPNIHRLGPKPYEALPAYLAGWDVAIMPFARNAATRCISPTKTPEYLAGGRPVVSTSIRDVVVPYGEADLVRIADDPASFVTAIEGALADDRRSLAERADEFLAGRSWAATWREMERRVEAATAERRPAGRHAAATRLHDASSAALPRPRRLIRSPAPDPSSRVAAR